MDQQCVSVETLLSRTRRATSQITPVELIRITGPTDPLASLWTERLAIVAECQAVTLEWQRRYNDMPDWSKPGVEAFAHLDNINDLPAVQQRHYEIAQLPALDMLLQELRLAVEEVEETFLLLPLAAPTTAALLLIGVSRSLLQRPDASGESFEPLAVVLEMLLKDRLNDLSDPISDATNEFLDWIWDRRRPSPLPSFAVP